jgi:bifunctional non-homologous end joining protein LigD
MEEIAAAADRVWSSGVGEVTKKRAGAKRGAKAALDPASIEAAKKAPLPAGFRPQLATLVPSAPEGEAWAHEVKYDGYRLVATKDGGEVRLHTRSGQNWTARFPTVAKVAKGIASLPVDTAIVDGEVVVLVGDGTSSFQALQNSIDRPTGAEHVYFAFDLPYCAGHDLTAAPLLERKALLARVLAVARSGSVIRYSDHVLGRGPDFLRAACELNLEGIVSKRADARYEQRRSRTWVKVKCVRRQEFVIGGWSDPAGARSHFGALLLGVYDDDGLRYSGKVGTGFNARSLAELGAKLKKLATARPPFVNPPRGAQARRSHWVRPQLVAEIAFTEWTSDGSIRHPSFQGLREDKDPRTIRREMPKPVASKPAKPVAS